MNNLLEVMQKKVDVFVEHYQTDFTVHDVATLTKEAKKGDRYYWLIRKNGTHLYHERDLMVKDPDWNCRDILDYYKDYDKHLYVLTITGKDGDKIEGDIRHFDYYTTCKELEKSAKNPVELIVHYKDTTRKFSWNEVGAPRDFIKMLSEIYGEHVTWQDIEYEFVF